MPKWSEVRRYLVKKRNGWEFWKKSSHHDHYRKILSDGTILTTRVSRGTGDVPPAIWKRMKAQMDVTDEEFQRGK